MPNPCKPFLLAALFICTAFGEALAQTTLTAGFLHDGIQREYRLHLPPNLQAGEQLPLVFNLHGFTSTAEQQELYSGMNSVADTARFFVCYPDGIGNAWNIGVAGGSTADDLGFIGAMIDSLHGQYGIDLERVYACGLSNGGFMSYRLACELGDRIAAIASVAGSMTTAMLQDCDPVRPIPILELHGDADPIVDFNGAMGNASVPEVIEYWRGQNTCIGPIATANFPDLVANDQATASWEAFYGCEDGTEVSLIRIHNGGHTWPGAFPTVIFGPTCQDLDASQEIWHFFNKYKLDLTSAARPSPVPPAFAVSPNPFQGELNLLSEGSPVDFARVFDAQGQLVWQGTPTGAIRTDAWAPGVYFLVVKMGGRDWATRCVKLR